MADDLIGYGGAVLWEAPQRTFRIREAAHYLVSPQHRDAAQQAEPAYQPAALATVARPVAGTVRINMVYTPPERRRNGHAAAVTLMTSRAILAGTVPRAGAGAEASSEVVLIADGNRPDRQVTRLGYRLAASARCSASARRPARCRGCSQHAPDAPASDRTAAAPAALTPAAGRDSRRA